MSGNASGYQNNRNWWTARQRVVVIEFATVEDAEAWDEAGQPLVNLVDCCAAARRFE